MDRGAVSVAGAEGGPLEGTGYGGRRQRLWTRVGPFSRITSATAPARGILRSRGGPLPAMKHVEERFGQDASKEVLLMCIGITSCVGRLIFGRVADYVNGVNKVYLQVASFFVIGLMSMMIPLCHIFGGLIAVCLLMGLFDGCFICIMAPIAFELVGDKDVSQAIGFLLGLMSVPMTVGPPIAGFIRDRLGSYDVAFYLAGIPPIFGGAVLCLIPWVEARRKRMEKKVLSKEQDVTQTMIEHEKAREDEKSKTGESIL
ncbi:unnamed protein product [Pleuronectes platessa]|uniref:Major facilitator superfamily (MFS) profile domain-containing protein n=1 Tax=Pleuronectes platessa TaxID=8262 RepID=A0A9N7Y808_PLEPL|nr:unnamed protein product [Pleuronectes platessa]